MQIDKNLQIMQNDLTAIESETLGMNNLSIETFRQDLTQESVEKYKALPNGIFSGFKAKQNGIVALLRNKKDKEQKLLFIDENGKEIALNQNEILQLLRNNRDAARYVPQSVENCDEQEIIKYSTSLRNWFDSQIPQVAIASTKKLFAGNLPSSNSPECVEEKYIPDNWNLICWETISNES
jgi:hypothetical protein